MVIQADGENLRLEALESENVMRKKIAMDKYEAIAKETGLHSRRGTWRRSDTPPS